jgi:hypothetical protein
MSRLEQRSIITYSRHGWETQLKLATVFVEEADTLLRVYEWMRAFRCGCTGIRDMPHTDEGHRSTDLTYDYQTIFTLTANPNPAPPRPLRLSPVPQGHQFPRPPFEVHVGKLNRRSSVEIQAEKPYGQ